MRFFSRGLKKRLATSSPICFKAKPIEVPAILPTTDSLRSRENQSNSCTYGTTGQLRT